MNDVLRPIMQAISPIVPIGAEWVSDETKFPYCVYQYSTERPEYQRGDFELVLDIWDRGTSVAPIEGICEAIKDELEGKLIGDNALLWPYNPRQSTIQEPDPRTKRRRLEFTIHYYRRESE